MGAAPLVLLGLLTGSVLMTDDPHPAAVTLGGGPRHRLVLGPDGKPLYSYDGIGGTNKECADECRKTWPPLVAGPDDKAIGDWSPKAMPNGGRQWAYKGEMIYGFRADTGSEKASGDGVANIWHALVYVGATPRVAVPGAASVSRMGSGFIMTDRSGHALYTFARDRTASACHAECLEIWPPLEAPEAAGPVGDWSPVDRADGIRQWAYRGRLVYMFSGDTAPGDAKGAGAGGVWQLIEVRGKGAGDAADAHSRHSGRRT